MDDFQRFHRKAAVLALGGLILILLGSWAAAAAGLWWAALLLPPVGGYGMRIVYNIQFRRFRRRQHENMYGKWKKYDSGDGRR